MTFAGLNPSCPPPSLQEYQQEFIAKWRSLDLDVLLAPALGPAFYIGYPAKAASKRALGPGDGEEIQDFCGLDLCI